MHQPFEDAGRVHEELLKFPQVLELHHVTGETDYLLKVIFRNRSELEEFVVSQLMTIPGIARIRTSLGFARNQHHQGTSTALRDF